MVSLLSLWLPIRLVYALLTARALGWLGPELFDCAQGKATCYDSRR